MPDLLIELFSEEIPARMQARAAEDLKKLVTDGLVEAGLTYASAAAFATPRRLALTVEGLLAESNGKTIEVKGPPADLATPVPAIAGFLSKVGLSGSDAVSAVLQLCGINEPRTVNFGNRLVHSRYVKERLVLFAVGGEPGRPAAEIVAEVLERTVRNFPWPKSMRWGSGSLRWVRPLHSILCLLTDEGGAEVVPLEIDGIRAGDTTAGHRFMAPGRFRVSGFDDYVAKLKRAHVILSARERAEHILHDARNMAFAQGLELVEDAGLLAEVAGLVEWPVVLMGEIGEAFLGLPPEVLRTSMKEHQKFFSVRNPKSGRIEKFVTVANRETADGGATILAGNRKVLTARLSDARFFWENDMRVARAGMDDWALGLASVTFHAKLGSQADRIARIATLAVELAPYVGADPDLADRAVWLAKLDLRSAMVGEFPELQGVMGRYYGLAAGEDPIVADAARDHWRPRSEGDEVPTDPVSVTVALADRIDTLTGFWSIDEKPTGSKDPFALRRAALGVIRLILTNRLRIELTGFLAAALVDDELERALLLGVEHPAKPYRPAEDPRFLAMLGDELAREVMELGPKMDAIMKQPGPYESDATAVATDLLSFLHERLKVYLRDRGIRHDVIDAVLAMPGNDDLTLLVSRAEALADTLKTEDGVNLIQGFRRAANILSQAEAKDGVEYSYGPDRKFAETEAERALFDALDAAQARIAPAMEAEDFRAAMAAMAALRGPIDAFFESVVVNAESGAVRRNRLNLLHRIRAICLSVADLARIEG